MIHFLTPVWGKAYVQLYLDVVIPAQLASRNLPSFKTESGTKYVVFTTREDMETIQSSPVFKVLSTMVPVAFEFVDISITSNHDRMSDCFRRGISAANAAGAAVIFLTPDIVFADGSFETIKRLADSGHDVVFIPAIRTLKYGVANALKDAFRKGQTIEIYPRDLMRVALDNLHPLADSSWWDEGETDLVPANLYWRVGNEGILGRCFHLHPVFVRPQRKNVKFFGTVDDDYCCAACPDTSKDYVVTDSDELLAVELSDPSHYFRTGFRKGSIDDTVAWAEQSTSKRHRLLFDRTIRMHTGIKNEQIWNQAASQANLVASSIKNSLALPLALIFLGGGSQAFRRLVRLAHDKRLELANEPDNDRSLRSAYYFKRWPIWSLEFYKRTIKFIWTLRNFYLGPPQRPRFYTTRYLIQSILRPDFGSLVNSLSEAVLVSEDPARSYIKAIADSKGSDLAMASFVESEGGNRLILHSTNRRVETTGFKLVLLEFGHASDLDKVVDAAYNVLRRDGRLLILILSYFGLENHSSDERPREIEGALQRKFRILEFRKQGGIGSALKLKYGYRFSTVLRRQPIVVRLIELTVIWIPVYMLFGSLLNIFAWVADRFDFGKKDSISSLTLAAKSEED
jgi:hypothetical protein